MKNGGGVRVAWRGVVPSSNAALHVCCETRCTTVSCCVLIIRCILRGIPVLNNRYQREKGLVLAS